MNKVVSLVLAFVLLLSLAPAVLADGEDVIDVDDGITEPDENTDCEDVTYYWYTSGMFEDVPEGTWYEVALSWCYDAGLIKGTSGTTFSPSASISLAQALSLAARLREYYAWDGQDLVEGSPWYQVYVDYALENGIIAPDRYSDYTAPATRRDMAELVCAALGPDLEYLCPPVCGVEEGAVPDVEEGDSGYDAIYALYRAGVLTGGSDGSFRPDDGVTRAEAVSILYKVLDEYGRSTFLLTKDGMYDIYVGGIGFNSPEGFEIEDAYDGYVSLDRAGEDGWSASIQIMSTPCFVAQEQFEERAPELFSGFLGMIGDGFEGGQEPEFSESAIAGLPARAFSTTYTEEYGSSEPLTVFIRTDMVLNANNHSLVFAAFVSPDGAEGEYLSLYDAMLEDAVVDKNSTGGQVSQEVAALMDKLAVFIPQYVEFARRFQETLKAELPDLYGELAEKTAGLVELITEVSGFDTYGLTDTDYMYILSRLAEIVSSIPGAQEYLESLGGLGLTGLL